MSSKLPTLGGGGHSYIATLQAAWCNNGGYWSSVNEPRRGTAAKETGGREAGG